MGAHFTALYVKYSTLTDHLAKYIASFRLFKYIASWSIDWPPRPRTVQKFAPLVFFGLFLPKLFSDLWILRKRVPIDEKLKQENELEQQILCNKSLDLIKSFIEVDIALPNESKLKELKEVVMPCCELVLQKYRKDQLKSRFLCI